MLEIGIIVFILLVVVLIVVLILWKNTRKRYKVYVEDSLKKIELFDELTEKYTALLKDVSENKPIALEVMSKYFDILTKAALLRNYLKADEKLQSKLPIKKFEEIVYANNSFPWESFLMTINTINDNVFKRLQEKGKVLDDDEFKICCLAYCGLTNEDISTIMNKNINTIKSRRLQLRKKLGINGYSNFVEEINTLIRD